MCTFSLQLLFQTFLVLRRIKRDIVTNTKTPYVGTWHKPIVKNPKKGFISLVVERSNILSADGIHIDPNNPFATLRFAPKPFLFLRNNSHHKGSRNFLDHRIERTCRFFQKFVFLLLHPSVWGAGDGGTRREKLQRVSVLFNYWHFKKPKCN